MCYKLAAHLPGMAHVAGDIGQVIALLRRTPAWEALRNKLKMRDTVFIVDDSGSMATEDVRTRDGRLHSRWDIARDLLEVISKAAK